MFQEEWIVHLALAQRRQGVYQEWFTTEPRFLREISRMAVISDA
jgi:hypothetical protein